MTPEINVAGDAVTSGEFRRDVLGGLSRFPKRLSSKYFYDQRGSELFDRICELDEYYPTRTELAIMQANGKAIGARLGPRCLVIEPGGGSSAKVNLLLDHMDEPAGYVPVDISREYMTRWAERLHRERPDLGVYPVHADFTKPFEVKHVESARRRVIFFPGSTIGNFTPQQAGELLADWSRLAEPGGLLLLGVDLAKDAAILEAAYDDREGVTAAFNLHLLVRLRDELGADIDPEKFEHRAFYNEIEGRVEMHIVSSIRQTLQLGGTRIDFEPGETIHTENSYKYDPQRFIELAAGNGWRHLETWSDAKRWFAVMLYEAAGD